MLATTTGFLDVAISVCCLSEELTGIVWCVVCLMARSGRPMIMVDNGTFGDELRRAYLTSGWETDPQLAVVREHHRVVYDEHVDPKRLNELARQAGYDGPDVHSLLLPVVDSKGLLAMIRIGAAYPFTSERRGSLALLANHVGVRFAELGVTAADERDDQLTARQREVAELAAQGTSNERIAEQLELSVNTVKKHLKDVFDRVDVRNRTALAARLRSAPRRARFDDIAIGVTRRGRVTITRSD